MRRVCPNCGKETEITLRNAIEKYRIKDQIIPVQVEYYVCSACGEDFATAEQMDKGLTDGYNKYKLIKKMHG